MALGSNMLKNIIKILILATIVFILAEIFLYKEPEFADFKINHPPFVPIEIKTSEDKQDKDILLDVPFIAQAPFGEWGNPVFQDACEEAAVLMVKYWLEGKEITKQEAYDEIIALADFEEKNYGNFYDHSAKDTAQIMKDYIGYQNIEARNNIDVEDIKSELRKGNLIVVPINGQVINNPYYTPPGPERHMLVIIGYNEDKNEFITNDSGTRMGKDYRYNEDVLFWSIRDYPTGHKIPILENKKAMIVIKK